MTEGTELDEIMSGDGEAVADDQGSEAVGQEQQPSERQRDPETGRFAAKAEGEEEGEQAQEATSEEDGTQVQGQQPGTVPHQALREERERRRELESQIQQLTGQMQLLMQRQNQPVPPKQEEQAAPELWEDPKAFMQHALTPVQQQMQQQAERFSRMMAVQQHGQEKVDQAYQALGQALQTDPSVQADYQRITKSEHPYDALVKWHQQQQTRQMVGDDPMAWFESEFEKRLSDPQAQAKILERIRGSAASRSSGQTKPVTNLPPSLTRIPGSGNQADDGDVSDEALFRHALGG